MSNDQPPRVSRRCVEQLLDGAPAPTEATRPLAALLRAAAAPAHQTELSGEQAALAAFEAAAQLDPVPSPRRQNVLKSTLAKILTVKAAVILAAAAGTTGVVLASTSGTLTSTTSPSEHRPADHPPAVHSPTHTPAGTSRNGDQDGKSSNAPSPSMFGLCQAYQAHKSDNPGKALDSPAFTALITAAGGKDNVDAYCDALVATKGNGRSDDTHGKPTNLPNNHGNGGNGGGAGNGNPPATHPATPPSRGHAPDNPAPTSSAESPNGAPTAQPVAGG